MINSKRKKILTYGLFLILCLTAIYPLILPGNNSIDQKTQQIPKLSQTIAITTPENKTYTEPMEGYYPATFGFEETANGVLPSYCDYTPGGSSPDGPGSYARVEDSWTDGAGNTHNKVFKTYDRTSSGTTHGDLNFTNEGSETCRNSTIEFWACNTQTGLFYHTYFEIWGDLGNMVSFEWDSAGTSNDPEIRITPATGEFGTGVYHEWNRWYRYSIDISCDGGYAGLGTNEFRFRVYNETNDLIYASADLTLLTSHPTGGPFRYHVLSTQSQSDVSHYLDGFGITGLEDGYELGDNLDEGLLLSFDSSATLDTMSYSLDGQDELRVIGNATIPFPDDGQHTIQLFGENFLGTKYHSPIRYFFVDTIIPNINIVTPSLNEFFGNTPPDFQISFTELNPHSTWYYLGPGTNEVIFGELTGTIDQLEWDKLGDGSVTIRFYINDTGGLENFEELIVQKDLTAPSSIISFTPYINPNIVNTSTTFSLASNDGTGSGVSILRYKINSSIWYDYSTAFDLSGYSYGNYFITYQAIDVVGNIESENTLLIILVEIPPGTPAIHGFNTVLILGLISLASIILIKKYKKLLKF